MTQPQSGSIAPISRRAVAYLIDALIAAGIAIVPSVVVFVVFTASASAATTPDAALGSIAILAVGLPIVGLLALGWFVFYTVMQSGRGSIGMRAQGLRLVGEDGAPLGFGRALLRNVVFGLAAGIVVGYFTPLFDGSGRFQGWHDKVAKAFVLDVRSAPAYVAATADPEVTVASGAPQVPAGSIPPAIPGLLPAPASGGFTPPSSSDASVPPAPSAAPAPPAPAPAPAPGAFSMPSESAPAPTSAAPDPFGPVETPPQPPRPFEDRTPSADEGSLIAFVPGVTQPGPPSRVDPTPERHASEPDSDLDPGLDETIVQRPSAPPAAAAEPVVDADAASPILPAPVMPPVPAMPASAAIPPVPAMPEPAAPPVPAMPESAAPPAPAMPASPPQAPAPAASAPEAPAPTTTPAFDAEHDEEAELEQTRISVPGHRLIFTWDDGTRVPVSRRTIFGRNPAPEDGAVLVPVRDETLSLSKTHFEAASESSGGWVLDRHSTNGMTIVRDGQRFACPAGQRVPVRLGDAIEIGDRIVTVGGYA